MSINSHVLCCRLAYNDITNDGTDISGVQALADALRDNGSLTECNVRGNKLDAESATLLAKVGTERQITLFGMKHDQTEADFSRQNLKPVDAILVASDLLVCGSLTQLDVSFNSMKDAGVKLLRDAVKGREGFVLKDAYND